MDSSRRPILTPCLVWNVMVIKDSSRCITRIWCSMRIQEAFTHTVAFNSGTTLWRNECPFSRWSHCWRSNGKWQSRDTNLDLLPLRSEHFPMYPDCEKYYYWLSHCSVYSLDIPGRGGGGKEGGSEWERGELLNFPKSPHFAVTTPLSSVLVLIGAEGVDCPCVSCGCKTHLWP